MQKKQTWLFIFSPSVWLFSVVVLLLVWTKNAVIGIGEKEDTAVGEKWSEVPPPPKKKKHKQTYSRNIKEDGLR